MEINFMDKYGNKVGYLNGLNDFMISTAAKSALWIIFHGIFFSNDSIAG
jgi:hypothetical protein